MVAICLSLHLLPSKVSIGIEKAFFHRIVSSYVTSTCSSRIFFQAGKVLRQILVSGQMHWQKGFQCPKDSIILQMQDILIARNFLPLFVVFDIIFRSRELQVFGMCFVMYLVFCYNNLNPIAQKMQRNYLTFVMPKHATSSSVFLEFSSNASKLSITLVIIHLNFKLAFLLLCALSRISFKKLTTMKV
jgi:hypothetical protein